MLNSQIVGVLSSQVPERLDLSPLLQEDDLAFVVKLSNHRVFIETILNNQIYHESPIKLASKISRSMAFYMARSNLKFEDIDF